KSHTASARKSAVLWTVPGPGPPADPRSAGAVSQPIDEYDRVFALKPRFRPHWSLPPVSRSNDGDLPSLIRSKRRSLWLASSIALFQMRVLAACLRTGVDPIVVFLSPHPSIRCGPKRPPDSKGLP